MTNQQVEKIVKANEIDVKTERGVFQLYSEIKKQNALFMVKETRDDRAVWKSIYVYLITNYSGSNLNSQKKTPNEKLNSLIKDAKEVKSIIFKTVLHYLDDDEKKRFILRIDIYTQYQAKKIASRKIGEQINKQVWKIRPINPRKLKLL